MIEVTRLATRRVAMPLQVPLVLAFGRLHERTALLVSLTDSRGNTGWGEVFANWPPGGAVHREGLLRTVFAPLLEGREFESPQALQQHLQRHTHRLRLQCDEPGPFDQCMAGVDLAAWHLQARARGQPAARALDSARGDASGTSPGAAPRDASGDSRPPSVPVYLSGIQPAQALAAVQAWWPHGVRTFKLMIGANWRAALPVFEALRDAHADHIELMADANQGFERDEAIEVVRALRPFALRWLEEPLPVDAPAAHWQAVADAARAAGLALAGGENLRSDAAFERALEDGVLSVLQPDLIKWGGYTRLVPLAHEALARGLRLCPHYLGGPIGWRASALWLAAVGGDGLLETDVSGHVLAAAVGLPAPEAVVKGGRVALLEPEPPA